MNGTGTADGKAITSYPLWVGNTRVNSLNCGNILGNGTASYDPDTQTLTLDNATITGSHEDAAIYYDGTGDLHIQGTGTVGGLDVTYGLWATKNSAITLDAGKGTLSFTGKVIGFRGGDCFVTILGGTVTATGNGGKIGTQTWGGYGLSVESLTVIDGKLTATSTGSDGCNGILVHKDFTIQGGTVEATGTEFGIQVGSVPPQGAPFGTLSIQGGKVQAKGNIAAIYVGKELTKTNSTEIVTPANGTIGKPQTQGYSEFTTILSGNEVAKEVDIRPLVRKITLAVDPAGGGEAVGGGEYDHGHTATVTAKANEGYEFVRWLEDGTEVSTDASYSFTVEKDRTLTAVFRATVSPPPAGGRVHHRCGRADEPDGTRRGHRRRRLQSRPRNHRHRHPRYTFVRWTEDGKEVSRNASYTFTVEKDRTLLAEFAVASSGGGSSGPSSYAVTPAKADNGTVTTDPAKAKQGDAVTVTPAPDEGYKAEAVTVTDKNGKPVTVKDNGDGTYSFTMPASAVNVAVSFAKEEIQPTPPTPADNEKIVDVPKDSWYHDAVYWAVAQGVTQGASQTAFSPLAPCTRAQMVTFLWRAAGEPKAVSAENPFTDVKDGAYYLDAVLWAVENGITQGTGKTAFSPDAKVTRAQTVTFLYRYEQSQGGGFTGAWAFPLDFSDAADVAQWAYEPFCWMTTHGVVAGSGGKLLPNANCSRAEIVTMLARYFAPA